MVYFLPFCLILSSLFVNENVSPITYGGGVLTTWIAFDALVDPLGFKIESQYFLTIPNYTYISL